MQRERHHNAIRVWRFHSRVQQNTYRGVVARAEYGVPGRGYPSTEYLMLNYATLYERFKQRIYITRNYATLYQRLKQKVYIII